MISNKSLILKKLPDGVPVPGEHLIVETRPIDIDIAPPGGIIVKLLYASFDPYLRGKMRDPSIKSTFPPFNVGKPIDNGAIAEVVKSNASDFKEGETVIGHLPFSQYVQIENPAASGIEKVQNPYGLDVALFLGALGMPGLTAWSGLYEIGKPKSGETIFISSAAGAVGQVVGQIAKREGLTVIGSVGSDQKLEFITKDLGFDAGFNYKKESPHTALPRLAPNGIDIYFENVGGDHLEAAIENMNRKGRIPVCGMIEGYNTPPEKQRAIKGLMHLVYKEITMRGFIVGSPEFGGVHTKDHQEKMQHWIHDGSLKAKLHVTEGIDQAAEGFIGMLAGDNFGKAVLKF